MSVNGVLARFMRMSRLVMNGCSSVLLRFWGNLLSHLSTWVNVVSLLVAIMSIYIALQSYRVSVTTLNDARAASVEQQRAVEQQAAALNDARRALEVISRATSIQQTLLAETSKSAATQVELLTKQQQRELEQADIEAVMLFPKKPAIVILNKGPRRVANDVLYSVALWNMSVGKDANFGLLGAKVGKADYILPGRAAGPMSLEFYPSVARCQHSQVT